MASMAAFVFFWSSAYEVSGVCATDTLYPSLLRMLATASQPEPSAKAPCTRTTFLTCCFMAILLVTTIRTDPVSSDVEWVRTKTLSSCAWDEHLPWNVKTYWLLVGQAHR